MDAGERPIRFFLYRHTSAAHRRSTAIGSISLLLPGNFRYALRPLRPAFAGAIVSGGYMFSRIGNLVRGFLSLFISGIEKRNPEALLELEQENLRKQIANFNQGLASHAGMCERIMGQVRKLEAEQKDLRAKTTAHLRAGNKTAAGQYALRLQTIEAQLEENRKQLEQAETTYKNLVKARDVAIQTARAKIESLKGAINDMRMNQAMAEIHEMASGMISSIGGSGDTLNRLHGMVEEERTKAAGRARIAKDSVDMSGVEVQEAEMNALADQALADFAAREGISLPGEAAAAPAARTMGPKEAESQSGS
jgi:phage shock protein A